MQKVVIGLVGEKGSGKETFGNLLQGFLADKTFLRIRSSDILAETLDLWDIPKTRANLQDLAIIMDRQFGIGSLSHSVSERIKTQDADIILFDGIRWFSDLDLIKKFPKNYLVYITADVKVRFERLKKRREKLNEGVSTFEQFMIEEKKKTETEIQKIAKYADFKIENNGTFLDLSQKVKDILKKLC